MTGFGDGLEGYLILKPPVVELIGVTTLLELSDGIDGVLDPNRAVVDPV